MTLFRVHCPTCNARLKVTSRSLIGQIVNCPKCGSMVEIAEPTASPESSPPPEKAKSKSKKKPSAAPVPAELPPPPIESASPSDVPGSDVSNSDEVFENVDELLDQTPPSPEPVAEATPAPVAQPVAEPSETPPPLDDRFADHSSVGKWRNVALIGGTSLVAVVVVAVIGYRLLSDGDQTGPQTEKEGDPAQVAQASPAEEQKPNLTEGKPADVKPEEKIESPVSGNPSGDPMPEKPSVEPAEETKPIEEPAVDPEQPAEMQQEKPGEDPSAKPADPDDENPFLFEPASGSNPAMPEKSNAPDGSGQPEDADSGPSILELKDDPLYEVFGESFPLMEENTTESSAANQPAVAANNPGTPALPPPKMQLVPPIPDVDVAERLKDPIAEIDFKAMPLGQFASFVTQMSTVPVTLDPVALASAEINANTPITVQQSRTSVQGILDAAVRPFGLQTQATGESVRLRMIQPLDGQMRTTQFLVDDLAEDQKKVADIAYMLTHLVEPLSWNQAGGKGLFRIDPNAVMVTQTEVPMFKSLVLLEKLRKARGLKPRSRYNERLFDLTTRQQQLEANLQKDVKLQIVVPTPLFKVIDQLEKKSGLTILCDWDSLARNKLGPATPVTLSAPGITAGETLSRFCTTWKLAMLPINATTVQLISADTEMVMPWLEVYNIQKLDLGKSQGNAMILEAKRELTDLHRTKYGEVLYDPVSKHLFALLSNDDHQRLQFIVQRKLNQASP
ncbi:hypothetical protein GC197_05660 [bacterium]|nr:hypothetical protein [bacterium]